MSQPIQGFQLSPQQKRRWLLQSERQTYGSVCSILIEGGLDPEMLKAALHHQIQRHDILRTTFHLLPGIKLPVQVIGEQGTCAWREVDLREQTPDLQSSQIGLLCEAEATRPFDSQQGPNVRATLVLLAAERHMLLLSLPTLCADAWTLNNLARDLSQAYGAALSGSAQAAEDEVVQYVQFSEWQNELLKEDDAEAGRQYWRGQDLSSLRRVTLPIAQAADSNVPVALRVRQIALEPAVARQIETLAQRLETTVESVLLAAWHVLLLRLTGSPAVVVGYISDGRAYDALHDGLGFFAKCLPHQSSASAAMGFGEWVAAIAETTRLAVEWQDYFVPEWFATSELANEEPLRFVFGFEYGQRAARQTVAGVSFSVDQQYTHLEPFQAKLSCAGTDAGLLLELHYDSAVLAPDLAVYLAEQFQTLLASAAAQPERQVGELPLVGPAERQRLLVDFNQTAAEYPKDRCIQQLFEAQVRLTPDAVAVIYGDQQLTYAELNQRANRLAHHLRSLGVGGSHAVPGHDQRAPGDALVGVYMERSLDMVVAVLGTLKAGGAYLPLDVSYPEERLSFMLRDAQAAILLTHRQLKQPGADGAAVVVRLDADWETVAKADDANPSIDLDPDQLAYVIYTSGSTGQPKGVMVTHGGLAHYVAWASQAYAVADGAGAPVHSPIGFDLTVTSLFVPLTVGRTVILVPEQEGVEALSTAIHAGAQLSLIKLTPSHVELLNQQLSPAAVGGAARALVIGGEALQAETLAFWRKHAPQTRLINEYGPTETVVGCCVYEVQPDSPPVGVVPIGRPIANTELYILDSALQLVPIGVADELYIGGVQLGRGYLGRPDLTAERFIPHPFNTTPGTRLYRSGDLARYQPDGTIEYIGRVDHQVKLRGFRIELGEIEAVLGQHTLIRECVAVVREDAPEGALGSRRLVAYVVPQSQAPGISAELRAYAKERLPEYMVPSAFVVLDSLPLTINGKVDRQALPVPSAERPEPEASVVAPYQPIEGVVAGIWADVLRVDRIGLHDHFFDLGGHSLLATQVISRVRDTFSVDVSLRSLVEGPTVAELSRRIEAALRETSGVQAPPLRPAARGDTLPVSFAQQRLWFLDQLQPGSSVYNVPAAVRLTGALDVAALEKSLAALIARHEVLRTTFSLVDGQPVQVVSPAQPFVLPVIDLQAVPDDEREATALRMVAAEAWQPFDLVRGPLLRISLFRLHDATPSETPLSTDIQPSARGTRPEHVLLLTMHHAISDGWSQDILLRELSALYEANLTGTPVALPEVPLQYADYAIWQRLWLQGEVLDSHLSYWREQLADVPVLQLPTDYPRPTVSVSAGAEHEFALPKDLVASLTALSRREDVTLYMTLLAAFQIFLAHYSGQEDIAVGTPIAGRTYAELEHLTGCFVNTLVLRTDLAGSPTFREVLRRVREVTLQAYTHQEAPFEQVVEAVQPERDLGRHPLFQVFFVFQNAPATELTLPGLVTEPLAIAADTVRFDLTLLLVEEADGLAGMLHYASALFSPETAARMVSGFLLVLEHLIAQPEARITHLPLVTDAERQTILVDWNATAQSYPQAACLHELFAAQVERTPTATAVVFEEEQLTYAALDGRSSQLAQHLRALGVGPEVRVGICVERSIELVVGLLGILKAGGAYVPLDPSYPQERLQFMLADTQAPVVLTLERFRDVLPQHQAQVICLDVDWPQIAQRAAEAPALKLAETNLAYVIYTSGSTGQPKGAMNTHQAIVNRLLWMQQAYQLDATDRVLQKTPFSFDVSVWEFFWPLLTGATLVVAKPGGHQDSAYLVDLIVREQITTLHFVPSMLHVFLEEHDVERCRSLRRVICSGEALPLALQQRYFARLSATLHNLYGPTEAAVDVTFWECHANSSLHTVPIGRPVANTQIYVLDRYLNPVPVGVAGELHIGGVQLARGYLNRPDLTAEKFIPDPFSADPSARLYKTGDLVRFLPDGAIEYGGRLDFQVKLRGFRIELGEIETVLHRHPAVKEGVVIDRAHAPGDARLVAYIVSGTDDPPTSSDLRTFLKTYLPEYMVPSAFVILDALPLTAHGKVDRRALPAPDGTQISTDRPFVPPSTPAEQVVANIWSQVLGIEQIGIHDHFFEIGGHSLLAMQVIAFLQDAFQTQLALRSLFDTPTVAGLVDALTELWGDRATVDEIAQLFLSLEQLPDEDVKTMLSTQS